MQNADNTIGQQFCGLMESLASSDMGYSGGHFLSRRVFIQVISSKLVQGRRGGGGHGPQPCY